jgi:hypothetical protein
MKQAFSKIWIIVIVFVSVGGSIFLWPKDCGKWAMGPIIQGATFTEECDCIGFKYRPSRLGGGPIYCYGIPFSRHCYENYGEGRVEVSCEQIWKEETPRGELPEEKWIGTYEYSEFAPPNQTWFYTFEVYRSVDQIKAWLVIDGFQTQARIQASVQEKDGNLDVIFEGYRPENIGEPYQQGDLLFSLEKVSDGEYKILWNKLQSNLKEPGVAEFKKLEQ